MMADGRQEGGDSAERGTYEKRLRRKLQAQCQRESNRTEENDGCSIRKHLRDECRRPKQCKQDRYRAPLRGELLEVMYGHRLIRAFADFKEIFALAPLPEFWSVPTDAVWPVGIPTFNELYGPAEPIGAAP